MGSGGENENMLARITQQDVVYRRLLPEHRAYIPDFGVFIKVQESNGETEYRSISRQLVLFCVERRKAWRMLQSKAGIQNREYKAQRSLLTDVDAGRISKEELFARGVQLLKDRMQSSGPAKSTEPSAADVIVDRVLSRLLAIRQMPGLTTPASVPLRASHK